MYVGKREYEVIWMYVWMDEEWKCRGIIETSGEKKSEREPAIEPRSDWLVGRSPISSSARPIRAITLLLPCCLLFTALLP